jgi:predicted acylesterase/phospholipase RssA
MNANADRLECDLVMKGGITSGVIYPRLVAKLAEVYDFRSIGGTSAGAIAAGAAAAAQLGVSSGGNKNAFATLSGLPELLGGTARGARGSMLLNLFQPQPAFRRHFALLTSALNARSKSVAGLRVAANAAWRFPLGALLGALPGLLIAWNSVGIARVLGVCFALLGLVLGAAVAALQSLGRNLPANDFGMCNGMPGGNSEADALSPWLHSYLNGLAGKPNEEPLTFGELWAGKLRAPGAPAPHVAKQARQIELAMITTAVNVGRPLRFPFEANDMYFVEQELRPRLPAPVISWLVAKARPSATAAKLSTPDRTFHALPDAADMPVLLGVRMSLSFPILLSAIPLYTVDRTREVNARAATVATRVLFSDGGICSNFPVHFFDGPLPSRPTFGVNLRPFHPDRPDERVWMPDPVRNNQGIKNFIPDISTAPGLGSVAGFLGSIVNTMQNWRDQVQIAMPGYRDRIVHVCHSDKEGGMNLDMESAIITNLARGGESAAEKLREAFVPGESARAGGWYNHRRIRMRTLLSGVDHQLRRMHAVLGRADIPTWVDVALDDDEHVAYRYEKQQHRDLAVEVLRGLADLGKKIEASGLDLSTGAPRPEAEWRSTPRV